MSTNPQPAEFLADVVAAAIRTHDRNAWDGAQIDTLRAALFEYRDRTEAPAVSPWERAVAGLNALVDAGVAFHVEPDGHISAPFSNEHIEWDRRAERWVLTHDEDDEVHP